MSKTMRVSPNQSKRYLSILRKRLIKLERALAKREDPIISVLLPEPFLRIKDPIPPPQSPCLLLEQEPLGEKLSGQTLAAIFLATEEALARPRTARSKK